MRRFAKSRCWAHILVLSLSLVALVGLSGSASARGSVTVRDESRRTSSGDPDVSGNPSRDGGYGPSGGWRPVKGTRVSSQDSTSELTSESVVLRAIVWGMFRIQFLR